MKKVYRLTSVILVVALLSVFLCVPASASYVDGVATLYYGRSSDLDILMPDDLSSVYPEVYSNIDVAYSLSSNTLELYKSDKKSHDGYVAPYGITLPITDLTSSLLVCFSYYLKNGDSTKRGSIADETPVTFYYDMFSNQHTGSGTWVSFDAGTVDRYGVSISAGFEGSEESPIHSLGIFWQPLTSYAYASYATGLPTVDIQVTSFLVIASDATGADLEELQNIASEIAKTNDILSSMYGDILAVCNAIYGRTGSMLEAQNLTNQYFDAIIPVLNGISVNTVNIYNLLSQQFSLLISTIESESDDIQSTIDNAVETLIAYLDNVFSGAVNPSLPGQSEDINSQGNAFGDAESGYQSTATERFESISADFAGFDGSVLSGVALASSLFQRVWNTLGDYVIIYTFPLTLSICLVIVGRVSRQHSRSKSGGKGGKPKDDGGGSG